MTMARILWAGTDAAVAGMVLIPVLLVYNRLYFRDNKKTICYILFSLYLAAVCVLVGLPSVTYVRPDAQVNLIPLVGMAEDWKNSLCNVLLFVPLGVALPCLWTEYRRLWRTATAGCAVSILIELLQMLTYRTTDINDVITNTVGTVLGFCAASVVAGRIPTLWARRSEWILLGMTVLTVMITIQPVLSAWIRNGIS